jgi:DinB family protein
MDRHLQRARDALQQLAGALTLEQLTACRPGKWNIAEILEHLGRAYSGTTLGVQRTIAASKPLARQSDFPSSLRAFIVVGCGYLPSGRAAPKMVVPVGIDPATAFPVAMDNLRQMDTALDEAASRFGAATKLMDHPIIGPLSVRQWRKFHWVHTRHHVRQIVARASGSTGSSGSGSSLAHARDADR